MTSIASATPSGQAGRVLPAAIGIALLTRLLTLGAYPLTDTTEARYAEVARKMVQLNDWVTPWYDYGVPFWAKPPLSIWMTALSFKILGISEFSARLPHLLVGAAVVWLVWDWMRSAGVRQAWRAAAIMCGAFVFYVAAGAVMTDMAMVLGTTMATRGMWLGMYGEARIRTRESVLAFAGMAIGLLAKGPVSVVLVLAAACGWAITSRNCTAIWRGLPWLRGATMASVLVLPWYALAERATPGFLRYFLLGEHLQRFLVSGWAGDRFGSAHAFPIGSMLLFAAVALLPWTLLLAALALRKRRQDTEVADTRADGLAAYLAWFALVPVLFFLPARNILWTYVLPAAPPFAALVALHLSHGVRSRLVDWVLSVGTVVMSLTLIGVVTYRHMTSDWKSAKDVIAAYDAFATNAPGPLLFMGARPYSASFYSEGQARLAPGHALEHQEAPVYVAVAAGDFYSLDFQGSGRSGLRQAPEGVDPDAGRCHGTPRPPRPGPGRQDQGLAGQRGDDRPRAERHKVADRWAAQTKNGRGRSHPTQHPGAHLCRLARSAPRLL